MSKELLKKVGIAVVALLVVCNTYNINKLSKSDKRMGGFARRVAVNAQHTQQRPEFSRSRGRTERGDKADWKKKKGEKPEANDH